MGTDGKPMTIKGGKHHTQKDVAKAIMQSIDRKQFVKTLTPAGKLLKFVQWIAPWYAHYFWVRRQRSKAFK